MDISLKRVMAFVIDIFVIAIIFEVVNLLPIDPYKEEYKESYSKYTELIKSDNSSEVKDEIISLNYEMYKYIAYSQGISFVILILYFGVLEYFLKGQTLGKRIMKLRVVSCNESSVTISKYILRIIVLNNIWLSCLNVGAVYVFTGIKFYYVTYVINLLSSLIYLINLVLIMFRKDNRGLHDFVVSTKVVESY